MERLTKKITKADMRKISKIQLKKFDYKMNKNDTRYYPIYEYLKTYSIPLNNGDVGECILEEHIVREVTPDYSPKSEWKHLGNEGGFISYSMLRDIINHLIEDGGEIYYEKRETLKGHRTRAPTKKSCPIKVNFRGMI